MSSLLSAISGKFSTNLILGTFFPVTVFVFLARVLWVPLLPPSFHPSFLSPLAGLDDKWELLILTLVTIVLSGLLYNLNIPVIRFYEGYPWMDSWIGRRRIGHYRAALQTLLAQQKGLYPLRQELLEAGKERRNVNPDDPQIPLLRTWIKAARAQEYAVRREVFAYYPPENLVLPTRLGNVIRSFESYPERQYGMAAITLWPRLIAVLDPDYAAVIDGAKAGVDFMLNSSVLAGLLSLLLLATGLVTAVPFASRGPAAGWLFAVALLAALSWWLYIQSIGGALDWGNLVRSAFDLYRCKLLEKLGYGRAPKTAAEERGLWQAISSRLVAGDPPPEGGEIPPYELAAMPATSCVCGSDKMLGIARGVVPLPGGDSVRVVIEIRNPDTIPHAPIIGLVVTDTVPEGFDYQWGLASASAGEVKVEGTNPYRFSLSEPLPPGDALQLYYRIAPRERGRR